MWLIGGGVGPALVGLPVTWAGGALASAAQRWFRRLRRTDDLSRLVKAASGTSADLTDAEFEAVRRLLEDQQTWVLAAQGTLEDVAARIGSCLLPRDGRTAEDSLVAARTIARGVLEFAVADLDPKLFQEVLLARLQRMQTSQAEALDEAMLGLHADLVTGFASLMGQLDQVLDRLPPGPAQRAGVAAYLRTLIESLSSDPWPRDRRFDGPVLTPAVIERKLRVATAGRAGERDIDADAMAQQCRRLVILGGPGSGKTWLARRTARRCAEDALEALAAGAILDEVELPLYTTCSRLLTAVGEIRYAAVSSALGQLADLGSSRLSAALREFFTERNAPVLLVIDSLDEAHGSDERLRQADTLPWRIVLTSRPSSWNRQLVLKDGTGSDRVGELQPLRYPDDVEPFIHRWFAGQPERGHDVAAQIARHPGLQQAATVPLILAFYCVAGGSGPLPEFRRDLYASVLKRMLTGSWRGSGDRRPDADTCLHELRAWAWSGAASHPISGVGTWTDDIPADRGRLGGADEDALDHVAAPLPPDIDGKSLRRFIHRSIREHLVAEHVASLPVDLAAEALLPHLWYDPDWEYAAPAAIVMHSQHDQLLRDLICRAARSDQIPGDLSVIDAGWEFRKLLARVAAESREADWSPEIARVIGGARAKLARSGRISDLSRGASWGTSNRQVRDALLGLLAGYGKQSVAADLVSLMASIGLTADDKRHARDKLLGLMVGHDRPFTAAELVSGIVHLGPTADDKRQARDTLLRLLAVETGGWVAAAWVDGIAQLDPTAEDKRRAREALLATLADQTERWGVGGLVNGLVQLAATDEDKCHTRDALLRLLASETDYSAAAGMIGGIVRLNLPAEDKRWARETLLGMLLRGSAGYADALTEGLTQVVPTAEDKRQARETILGLLADPTKLPAAAELVSGMVQLDPIPDDRRRAREMLLGLLARQASPGGALMVVNGLILLDLTADDKRQARPTLLGMLLDRQTGLYMIDRLVDAMVQLDPAADERRRVQERLLRLLDGQTDRGVATWLVGGLVHLATTAEDKRRARETILRLLDGHAEGWVVSELVRGLAQVVPMAEDKRQARETVLGLLNSQTDSSMADKLAVGLVQLGATAEDKRQARETVLGLLDGQADGLLVRGLAELDPTIRDLTAWRAWAGLPTVKFLLAAARRNSALADWLTALPSLSE